MGKTVPNPMYADEPIDSIIVEIEAACTHESEGKVTLRLEGVRLAEPDWPAVGNTLEESGISKADAMYLVEQFADTAHTHLLARLLASKMRRVG